MKIVALLLFLPFVGLAQSFREVTVSNGDVNLYVKVFGEGDPIILINGGPGMNSNGFNSLAQKLTTHNQVILYDQRGTGRSTMENPNEDNMTMDWMVDDLEAIREYFEFPAWIVYGHSFGGMLAYKYAADHPEHVWAMVQSSSGGMNLEIRNRVLINERLTEEQSDSLAYFVDLFRDGDSSESTMHGRRHYLSFAYVYHKSNASIVQERLREANFNINSLVWGDMISTGFDQSDHLTFFDAPVLILYGDHDVVDPSLAEFAGDVLENVTIFEIPKCGHYGWLDNPEFYFDKVNHFLKGLPPMDF